MALVTLHLISIFQCARRRLDALRKYSRGTWNDLLRYDYNLRNILQTRMIPTLWYLTLSILL